jgi:hypothetical protein
LKALGKIRTSRGAMITFKDLQIQFEQRFDGAYGFFDKSGEFVSALREELGFVLLTANLTGCDLESPDTSLRLRVSAEQLLVVSTEPEKQNEFVRVADFASKTAVQLFSPFVVEYNHLTLSSLQTAPSLQVSFSRSITLLPTTIQDLSEELNLPALNQDFTLSFESGTLRVHVRMQPAVRNVTVLERRLPVLGLPKSQSEHLLRREKKLSGRTETPSYGVSLDISVIESEPVTDASIDGLCETLVQYKKKILKFLKS